MMTMTAFLTVTETQYSFLNTLDSSDASLDQDGDGFTNKEEFDVGSDPEVIGSNPAS